MVLNKFASKSNVLLFMRVEQVYYGDENLMYYPWDFSEIIYLIFNEG